VWLLETTPYTCETSPHQLDEFAGATLVDADCARRNRATRGDEVAPRGDHAEVCLSRSGLEEEARSSAASTAGSMRLRGGSGIAAAGGGGGEDEGKEHHRRHRCCEKRCCGGKAGVRPAECREDPSVNQKDFYSFLYFLLPFPGFFVKSGQTIRIRLSQKLCC